MFIKENIYISVYASVDVSTLAHLVVNPKRVGIENGHYSRFVGSLYVITLETHMFTFYLFII